jgi:hypothetical protein
MRFTFTWLMDKLGYMPKIDFQVGKVDLKPEDVWPFPIEKEVPKKQAKKVTVPKATTRKKPAAKKNAKNTK